MAEPTPTSSIGTVGGHYKLLSKLGEGAFGEVHRARHELLEQEFAVKILKPELCEDQQVRDRFLDEARALIRFSHPNVVQLRHVGEHEGRLYLVMDFVPGEPLNDVLRKAGTFSEQRALALMDQVLQGLSAAHAVGIVHRDLKPSNMLVEPRPEGGEKIHILDFGLSKLGAAGDGMKSAHRSVSGSIIGTLAYMSPEQIQGQIVDQRSDVFAAGLVLMEMLQGHHPYPGESGIMVAARLLRDPIPPLDPKVAAKITPATRMAISTALERDRDARFPSATAFAHALQGKGPPSDTSRVTTIESARQELARAEQRARLADAEKKIVARKKGGTVALLAALLAAGGGAAWWFLAGPGAAKDEPRREAPTPEPGPKAPPAVPAQPVLPSQPEPAQPDPAPAPVPAPAAQPGPQPTPQPTPEPTPEPAPQPGPQPTPEPGPQPAPEPAPEPAPAPPSPPQPTPSQPTPTQPTPSQPTPSQPNPVEPTPPQPTPSPPTPPLGATKSPAEWTKAAEASLAQGQWAQARAAGRSALEADPFLVPALVVTSKAWMAEASMLGRSGKLPEAQALLTEAGSWLADRYAVYEKARDVEAGQLQRLQGFARMFSAESHSERMRWHQVAGQAAPAAQERKVADEHFEFAWQFLQRDSVNYWEFLIRRAAHRIQTTQFQEALEDLAITTQTNNLSVPAHMWHAHARGTRLLVEIALAKGDTRAADGWAKKAVDVVQKGEAWKSAEFTQDQWLEGVRVLALACEIEATKEGLTPLRGLLGWYVKQAGATAAPPYQAAEVTRAKLATAQAALALVNARYARLEKKEADAVKHLAAAEASVREAIALREQAAQTGGLLPGAFPYHVLADVQRLAGKTAEAADTDKKAWGAHARNAE
jgi:serine/threonine-protein kinase